MKTVLVTGASLGIGAATAVECARQGLGVILTYKSHLDEADAVVRQIEADGGRALALPLDVMHTASFVAFAGSVRQALRGRWGTDVLSGLVNNAGFGFFKEIEHVSESEFDALFNAHVKAPFFLTQHLLPLLSAGSSIVNITSATTRVATVGVAPYACCKGALEVLTRYMAKEFGPRAIRVNAVSPGPIRTSLGGGISAEFEAVLADQTALARIGEPTDVARVIAMLVSDAGQWINGQSIEVAGGYQI